MADSIKIGNLDISSFKVGDSDVDAAYLGDTLVYSGGTPPTPINYLRFVSRGSGTFTFFANGGDTSNKLKYSLNSGSTWTELENGSSTTSVSSGDVIMWKGENLSVMINKGIGTFSSTTQFDVEGNIMSLIYGDNFENETSLNGKDYIFMNLFSGCTTVISVENMELPATTLSTWCYTNMFNRASNLTTPPKVLPATSLVSQCYYNMFYSCSSLTASPLLPAPTLVTECYRQMFRNCTNISSVTCLATNISATDCTNNWLYNAKSTGTFIKDANMSSWTTGTSGIPTKWTVLDYSS